MNWEVIVGANIRRHRKAKGLTQEQLAHEAGVAMRYVAGVERAEENPSLKFLVKIAQALEIDPEALLHSPRQAVWTTRIPKSPDC